MNLFEQKKANDPGEPLAYRMRPKDLDEYTGQSHLIGPGAPLRRIIEEDRLHSFVLYGPPGCGKTTLALIIANQTKSHFEYIKAVTSGVTELRRIADDAQQRLTYYNTRTILFVDEVHRFNKSQQDVLLPFVESGLFTLIGATTENPLYEINSALLSRLRIYILEPLEPNDIEKVIDRAISDVSRGLGQYNIDLCDEALQAIVARSKGDARTALNILETAYKSCLIEGQSNVKIELHNIEETAGHFFINYDKKADCHYDTISAFIKSVRGSDPDAALFWLAVMIHGGEDPLFIARRLVILAAEDIGLADPHALPLAVSAFQAAHFIGLPEARIPLAEAVIYLSTAPKSNSTINAIDGALDFIRNMSTIKVPGHISDSSHSKASMLGKGAGYKYPHSYGGYTEQSYLPEEAGKPEFYKPTNNGNERRIKEFIARIEELKRESNERGK